MNEGGQVMPGTLRVPAGKKYLPYQEKGIVYALGAKGTLFADEMGLGKTVEAIGVLNQMDFSTLTQISPPVLIVAPAGLVMQWRSELQEWYIGSQSDIAITSYTRAEQVARDWGGRIKVLIFDEAHYIKNAQAKRTQAAKKLVALTDERVLMLTGTPMDGKPADMWPLLQMLCPEKWDPPELTNTLVIDPEMKKSHPGEGPGFWEYAKRYCDLKYTYHAGRNGRKHRAIDFSGNSNLIEFHARLKNTCMVRRLKKDVLSELPPKRRQVVLLAAEAFWNKAHVDGLTLIPYEITESNYEDAVNALHADRVKFAEWSKTRHEQGMLKVGACAEFILNALEESPKIIVFAYHLDVIEALVACLRGELGQNEEVLCITGDTPLTERMDVVRHFQTNAKSRIVVGSIGAMGVGFNLNASSHVIFCELDPAIRAVTQAEDRPHRIGQRDMVLVQHLVVNGSLCARLAKILVKKQDVIDIALDGKGETHGR